MKWVCVLVVAWLVALCVLGFSGSPHAKTALEALGMVPAALGMVIILALCR